MNSVQTSQQDHRKQFTMCTMRYTLEIRIIFKSKKSREDSFMNETNWERGLTLFHILDRSLKIFPQLLERYMEMGLELYMECSVQKILHYILNQLLDYA